MYEGQNATYVDALWSSGAQPLLIPTLPCKNEQRLFEAVWNVLLSLDGLLLAGGSDLESGYFGELPHPQSQTPDYWRDAWEMMAVRIALARKMPVLGICRGAQLMNVACGGTLWQDLRDKPGVSHRILRAHSPRTIDARNFSRCRVTMVGTSTLSRIVGKADALDVFCLHHQAVRDLAPVFRSSAECDGFCHAFERVDGSFACGIQFHAEEDGDAVWSQRLFHAFLAVPPTPLANSTRTLYDQLRVLLTIPDAIQQFPRFLASQQGSEVLTPPLPVESYV